MYIVVSGAIFWLSSLDFRSNGSNRGFHKCVSVVNDSLAQLAAACRSLRGMNQTQST